MDSPSKSFTCRVAITTAMPPVKPRVTDSGIYSMKRPRRSRASPTSNSPAITEANSSPARPYCWAMGKRITTKAAVGPDTLKREPPARAIRKPAMTAV